MVDTDKTVINTVFDVLGHAVEQTTGNVNSDSNEANTLPDRWGVWYEIATRYSRKVPIDDRPDVLHDILIELEHAQKRDGIPLPIPRARKIASITVAGYWRKRETPRPVMSLDADIEDSDGSIDTLESIIPDDSQIDLDAHIEAKITLSGCPDRIVQLGKRLMMGEHLNTSDRMALMRFRARYQKKS